MTTHFVLPLAAHTRLRSLKALRGWDPGLVIAHLLSRVAPAELEHAEGLDFRREPARAFTAKVLPNGNLLCAQCGAAFLDDRRRSARGRPIGTPYARCPLCAPRPEALQMRRNPEKKEAPHEPLQPTWRKTKPPQPPSSGGPGPQPQPDGGS